MEIEGKKVLILGLGITGISACKVLSKRACKLYLYDDKYQEQIEKYKDLKEICHERVRDIEEIKNLNLDFCLKSPGIKPSNPVVEELNKIGLEVISDLELASRLYPDRKIIAITGTNGKTTTTTLVGEICKNAGYTSHVVGNIGVGMLPSFEEGTSNDAYVIECSSFQLENTSEFKPLVSGISNITPDHLDWHGSMENYTNAKLKVYKNQDEKCYTILNYDDQILRQKANDINSKLLFFSKQLQKEDGVYLDKDKIILKTSDKIESIMPKDEIFLVGSHNLENILMAIGLTLSFGIDKEIIRNTIKNFKGVEHRIEFVREVQGVKYYNDSKGTNVDASVCAINAFDHGLFLIAGGYDKKVEFDELFKAFKGKVKKLLLLGQTRDKLKETAEAFNFKDYVLVENMEEALKIASKEAESGDTVLLSPACASWGMYNNFEERGRHFKNIVNNF